MVNDLTSADDFDRGWADLVARDSRTEALYVLIGLTRLGERPATVRQLAAALDRPQDEAIELAWEAARVRPENGRIRLESIWPGATPRRKLHVGRREMPVSGCAPDLFVVAAVVDVPFWVDDICPAAGTAIRVGFVPAGVEWVDPPQTVAAMLSPDQLSMIAGMEIEQINADLCVQQPFFSSAQAAERWLLRHPGGRALPVRDMVRQAFVTHARDIWRLRVLANTA